LVRETRVSISDLIWPLFVIDGSQRSEPIPSMPGVARLTIDLIVREAHRAAELGIPALALFPYVDSTLRDNSGSEALRENNLICRVCNAIAKEKLPVGLITDVALDPYTSHGHDGLLDGETILNDETIAVLTKQAVLQAQSGSDVIAPSDMMDGRVGAIRSALDRAGFQDVQIMSYAAKYASAFYGPFRDAIGTSKTLKGDKRTYQMDPANTAEAMREVALDLDEGADICLSSVRRVRDDPGCGAKWLDRW